jgi:hypothetical protein
MATPAKRSTHTPLVGTEAGAEMTLMDGGLVWAASEKLGWIRGKIVNVSKDKVQVVSVARPFADDMAGVTCAVELSDLLPVCV